MSGTFYTTRADLVHGNPASGSGAGCLAAYLSKYQYFGTEEVDIKVEQGIELGRPSQICASIIHEQDSYTVSVGGQIILMGKGELFL